jgi:hypothetical protein
MAEQAHSSIEITDIGENLNIHEMCKNNEQDGQN